MSLIADILLVAASVGLAVYCVVLSRRLSRFTDLEKGVGGAVAILSAQVDDLTRALKSAQTTAQASANALTATTERAEDAARRLELHVAALHDLPSEPAARPGPEEAADEVSPKPSGTAEGAAPGGDAGGMAEASEEAAEVAEDGPVPAFSHAKGLAARSDAGAMKGSDAPGVEPATLSFTAQRRIQPGALG